MEDVFRDVRDKWQKRRMGLEMSVGAECHLQSLCFADDVLLLARSRSHLREMLEDFVVAACKRGLAVHPDKTKILTNADIVASRRLPSTMEANNESFEVLGSTGTAKWLGRKVRFHDPHESELCSRIASAWGAFTRHKEELTSRRFRLHDRLRLFNAVVSSTVLYGCETWTLRKDQQLRLRSVQRKMLRLILNAKRWKLEPTSSDSSATDEDTEVDNMEPWAEFMKRTARWTEEQLAKAGQSEWLDIWRRRQWRWASKLATADAHKWSATASLWQPVLHSSCPRGRAQARPKKRWDQDIVAFLAEELHTCSPEWFEQAQDNEQWMKLLDRYAAFMELQLQK